MANFIEITRVFVKKGAKTATGRATTVGGVQKQKIKVRKDVVDTVRASNRLGFPEHRSSITLRNGQQIEVMDTYADLSRKLGA